MKLTLLVSLSLLTVVFTDAEIICSSRPVDAVVDQDVTLQCHLDPPQDATDMTVEWHHRHEVVHLYQARKHNPVEQTEHYEGRTSLFHEGLAKGYLSLKLSSVRLKDSGRYKCSFITDKITKSCYVNLTVGESDVIGSHEPINVVVGRDVILPCQLKPPFNVRTLTVEWKCNQTNVHIYRSRRDHPEDVDERFKHRTSLFHDEMANGNISLKLTKVTELDAGNYTCYVPKLHSQVRRGYINLVVDKEPESDKDPGEIGDSGDTGAAVGTGYKIAIGVLVPAAVVVAVAVGWKKCMRGGKNRRRSDEQNRTDNHELEGLNDMRNTSNTE